MIVCNALPVKMNQLSNRLIKGVEMKIKYFCVVLLAFWIALLTSCVTINIYFPAAAAEKAADKIIEEVWQLDQKEED